MPASSGVATPPRERDSTGGPTINTHSYTPSSPLSPTTQELASPFSATRPIPSKSKVANGSRDRRREVGSVTVSLRSSSMNPALDLDAEDEEEDGASRAESSASPARPTRQPHSFHHHRKFRPRANSLRVPNQSTASSMGHKFFLPHYSTDQKFSLRRSGASPNLDLRLGVCDNHLDSSLGDAIRRGANNGGEVALPKAALRLLSEAKVDMDQRAMSKQTRKGSIGMGLFKETRSPSCDRRTSQDREKKPSQDRRTSGERKEETRPPKILDEVKEEEVVVRSPVEEMISSSPTVIDSSTEETAKICIVPSPRRSFALDDPREDDSGWTSSTTSLDSDGEVNDLFGSDTETDEEHMTVPLQPYGHKVGGHSSIYQFTRAAICKPLVGRENIIYENVERLAPALLPYIPRYLGVMLVNYRRQVRTGTEGSQTPAGDMALSPSTSHPPTPGHRFEVPKSDAGISDVEVPEVSLDFNRHVVPDWLFRSTGSLQDRGRRRLHSNDGVMGDDYRRPSSVRSPGSLPRDTFSATSSMGCLSINGAPSSPGSVPRRLIREEPSTPAHSPASPKLHHTSSSPALHRQGFFSTIDSTISLPGSPHPAFGGTGSTTVNNKLKDHVFSAIFKKLKKRGVHVKHDDDADDEHECAIGSRCRRSRPGKGHASTSSGSGQPRRVNSEQGLSGSTAASTKREDSADRSGLLFAMDDDEPVSMQTKHAAAGRDRRQQAKDDHDNDPLDVLPAQSGSPHDLGPHGNVSYPPSPSVPPSIVGEDIARQELFIFMEDLTGRLKRPCVLDLKMGTRQYGYDATPLKKISQRKKCDTTTSRTLGVRMCGMQVSHLERTILTEGMEQCDAVFCVQEQIPRS